MKDEQFLSINYNKVVSPESNFSGITKMTAANIIKNPYMNLGTFFKGLTNNDVTVLNLMVEMMDTDIQSAQEIILLTEMLSRAEGTEGASVEDCTQNVNSFVTFITIVSLERKGLVRVFYENLSFGEDMAGKPIVEPIFPIK